ncbi:hypothetical protein KSZ_17560 [Dictyobacter formicarum]|uniref:Uncharacterized protein n=1 Tax=Dictyobacter formicarum TaxID=2778368 RepID=A0ABQ3VC72_9CHLR|nr:hypothetical protein KSZ_17560 [Dictyobacter formicarum]
MRQPYKLYSSYVYVYVYVHVAAAFVELLIWKIPPWAVVLIAAVLAA